MKRISPTTPPARMVAFRCDEDLYERISQIAERDGVTVSHAIRELIVFALPTFEQNETAPVEAGAGEEEVA